MHIKVWEQVTLVNDEEYIDTANSILYLVLNGCTTIQSAQMQVLPFV